MRELTDELLQDYVDGRLSDAERTEVEGLLRADPDKARRVESWRVIGRTLRNEQAELSPGFYARARERFERSVPAGPRGWHVLSWETAGLATAAVRAGAIVGPARLRDPELGRQPDARTELDRESERSEGKKTAADPSPSFAPQPEREVADSGRRAAERPEEAQAEVEEMFADRAGDFAPVPPGKGSAAPRDADLAGRRAEVPMAEAAQPPAAVRQKSRERVAANDDLADDARESRAAAQAADELPPAEKVEAGGLMKAVTDTVSGPTAAPAVVELPPDAAPSNGIHLVETRSEWEARLADGKTLAPLGGYDDDLRLVLVGALRADCASLSITRDSTGYRVKLLRNGSAAGCAFVLPDDGLPVSLDE